MKTHLFVALLLSTPLAQATDPFVQALQPCLELMQTSSSEPTQNNDAARYQIVLDQGWTMGLFALSNDNNDLGTDQCGNLNDQAMELAAKDYAWPEQLGARRAVDLDMLTAPWLEMILRQARAQVAAGESNPARPHTGYPEAQVQRVIITALPDGQKHLVRVKLSGSEAAAESMTIDLDASGAVLLDQSKVPDLFITKAQESRQPVVQAEGNAAPTIDPRQALKLLYEHTTAKPNDVVLRVTFSSFSAGLVYRSAAQDQVRQTEFNYIEGKVTGLADSAFELPSAFKPCAMTQAQVRRALDTVIKQPRYLATAKRLQHLLLECSEAKPKPHFSLVALEPFEYFDLPASD